MWNNTHCPKQVCWICTICPKRVCKYEHHCLREHSTIDNIWYCFPTLSTQWTYPRTHIFLNHNLHSQIATFIYKVVEQWASLIKSHNKPHEMFPLGYINHMWPPKAIAKIFSIYQCILHIFVIKKMWKFPWAKFVNTIRENWRTS